uniref:DNA topoisomerase 2 n=1 Tax=Wuchereria bancrofti TaxID=6293 RepID=A0A1I8EJA9_WUCBA
MIAERKTDQLYEEAIFLYYKNNTLSKKSGFVAIFDDSSCLEVGSTSDTKSCIFLLEALLESALEGDLIESLRQSLVPASTILSLKYSQNLPLPKRLTTSNFAKYSKVIMSISADAEPVYREHPKCWILWNAISQPVVNVTLSPTSPFKDLSDSHLKVDRSDLPDGNQFSNELTSAQLHEIIQFFDANVENDVEQTHQPSILEIKSFQGLLSIDLDDDSFALPLSPPKLSKKASVKRVKPAEKKKAEKPCKTFTSFFFTAVETAAEDPMDVFMDLEKEEKENKGKLLSIEKICQKKSQLEHILLRPDTYIGSVEYTDGTPMWVYDTETDRIVQREISYVPGLYKIFDEILVNAADNKQRDPKMNLIKVNINKEKNEISIYNNGRGIPVVLHKIEKLYVPELIFGTLLTSSNYDDSERKVTGGRNGYGAKLCNMFSKEFTLETSTNEYLRFSYGSLMVQGFKQYVEQYNVKHNVDSNGEAYKVVYESVSSRWEVALTVSDKGFQQVSFTNSIATTKGGRHVDYVVDQIASKLIDVIKKKIGKSGSINVKPFQIKNHMWIFVNALIENPTFDSQTKETMTLQSKSFDSTCELSEKFVQAAMKCGIVEAQQETLDKKCSSKKTSKLKGVPKLEDANDAGTKNSAQSTLILTEGDSAKLLAVSGLGVVGRDKYGVFPLRGKMLNVREGNHEQIMENAEVNALLKIIGLQYRLKYDKDEDMKTLRYGKIMVMTDQDQDGSHIKGLVVDFIHYNWPALVRRNFIEEFITPIVKATKRREEISFFHYQNTESGLTIQKIGKHIGLNTTK